MTFLWIVDGLGIFAFVAVLFVQATSIPDPCAEYGTHSNDVQQDITEQDDPPCYGYQLFSGSMDDTGDQN